jgi:lipid-binding SYLF domain-containing protein
MLKQSAILMILVMVAGALALPLWAADDATEASKIVAESRITLGNFLSDPDMKWIRQHFSQAKGVLIIPSVGKGAFIIGGSGGVGVLLTRNAKGQWSEPAFYKMGSVSIGLQVGGSASEVLLFIQSQKGVDSFLSNSFKLGADASVAAGPVGQGSAASSDILAFARSKGAYLGASFDGSVVNIAEALNKAFYGKDASPVEILVRGGVKNKEADGLRADLAKATAKK